MCSELTQEKFNDACMRLFNRKDVQACMQEQIVAAYGNGPSEFFKKLWASAKKMPGRHLNESDDE